MADEQTPLRTAPRTGTPKVKWDTSNMRSSYANVANVTSTREEVVVIFGMNQAWTGNPNDEVTVQLNERLILSPFAAKRLALLLNKVVAQYEERFGSLDTVSAAPASPTATN